MKAVKEITRKYYKYVYTTFEQPPLSSNGTMGADRWAVSGWVNGGVPDFGQGTPYGSVYPQTSSYNVYSKGGQPSIAVIMYTPTPTIITGLTYTAVWGNYGDSYVYVRVRASNDNSNWTVLYPQAGIHEGTQTLTFTNTVLYKYYELYVLTTGGGNHDGIRISGVKLIGQEKTVTEGTEQDYDYFRDTPIYKVVKVVQPETAPIYKAVEGWVD